ncbi:MAG: hypothetical protein WCQ61_08710, partial [Proteiniphilum sp.]
KLAYIFSSSSASFFGFFLLDELKIVFVTSPLRSCGKNHSVTAYKTANVRKRLIRRLVLRKNSL